jgi:hypothetical protein
MPFNVRIFAYAGTVQIQQTHVRQFNSDSVFVLQEPYIWSQVISVADDGSATPSIPYAPTPDVPDTSQILRVEIPDGKQVRFEINPNGNNASTTRVAGNASPRISGFNNFEWGPGYTISLCDAAAHL